MGCACRTEDVGDPCQSRAHFEQSLRYSSRHREFAVSWLGGCPSLHSRLHIRQRLDVPGRVLMTPLYRSRRRLKHAEWLADMATMNISGITGDNHRRLLESNFDKLCGRNIDELNKGRGSWLNRCFLLGIDLNALLVTSITLTLCSWMSLFIVQWCSSRVYSIYQDSIKEKTWWPRDFTLTC